MDNNFSNQKRSKNVTDLPSEMLAYIFQYLKLHDLVILYSKVCPQWQGVIAQLVLGSKIRRLAFVNAEFKREITENHGWKEARTCEEDSNEPELILSIYQIYGHYSGKCLMYR